MGSWTSEGVLGHVTCNSGVELSLLDRGGRLSYANPCVVLASRIHEEAGDWEMPVGRSFSFDVASRLSRGRTVQSRPSVR